MSLSPHPGPRPGSPCDLSIHNSLVPASRSLGCTVKGSPCTENETEPMKSIFRQKRPGVGGGSQEKKKVLFQTSHPKMQTLDFWGPLCRVGHQMRLWKEPHIIGFSKANSQASPLPELCSTTKLMSIELSLTGRSPRGPLSHFPSVLRPQPLCSHTAVNVAPDLLLAGLRITPL